MKKALYFKGDTTPVGIMGYYTLFHAAFNNLEYYWVNNNNYWGGTISTRPCYSTYTYPISNPDNRGVWEWVFSQYTYTMMAWVNPYYLDKSARYVFRDAALQGSNVYIDAKIAFYHNRIEAQHKFSTTGLGIVTYKEPDGSLLKVDKWYHVCITFGSDDPWSLTKTFKFYVNGNLVGSYDYVFKTRAQIITIGGPSGDILFGYNFIGLFNGFKSFGSILTQSQIQHHMDNTTDYTGAMIYMDDEYRMMGTQLGGNSQPRFYFEIMQAYENYKSKEDGTPHIVVPGSGNRGNMLAADLGVYLVYTDQTRGVDRKEFESYYDVPRQCIGNIDVNVPSMYHDYYTCNYQGAVRIVGKLGGIIGMRYFSSVANNFLYSSNVNLWPYGQTGFAGYTISVWACPDFIQEMYNPISMYGATLGLNKHTVWRDYYAHTGVWFYPNKIVCVPRYNAQKLYDINYSQNVITNRWYHLSYVVKCVGNNVKNPNIGAYPFTWLATFYVNGKVAGTSTWNNLYAPGSGSPTSDIVFGGEFYGRLQGFALTFSPLTQEEVLRQMHRSPNYSEYGCYFNDVLDYKHNTPNFEPSWDHSGTADIYIPGALLPPDSYTDYANAVWCISSYPEIDYSEALNPTGYTVDDPLYLTVGEVTDVTITTIPDYAIDKKIEIGFDYPGNFVVGEIVYPYSQNSSMDTDPITGSIYTKITALVAGRFLMTVYNYNNPLIYTEVTVIAGIRVSSISIDKTTMTLSPLEQQIIMPTVLPSNAEDKEVLWSSNNESIASVNDGVVSGVANGTCIITAETRDKHLKAYCTVTVIVKVSSITLNKHIIYLEKGYLTSNLFYTLLPSGATNKAVTWSYSIPGIATILNGVVSPIRRGITKIRVTAQDGSEIFDECEVTVKDAFIAFFDIDGNQLNGAIHILKYLGFYNFVGGDTTTPKYVKYKNNAERNITDLIISFSNPYVAQGITVEMSTIIEPFLSITKLPYSGVFHPNDEGYFYIRLVSTPQSQGLVGEFDILAQFNYE